MSKLVAVFKRILKIGETEENNGEGSGNSNVTAAVPSMNVPGELHPGRRRLKEHYTSHWDLDYLPREETEKIIAESERKRS